MSELWKSWMLGRQSCARCFVECCPHLVVASYSSFVCPDNGRYLRPAPWIAPLDPRCITALFPFALQFGCNLKLRVHVFLTSVWFVWQCLSLRHIRNLSYNLLRSLCAGHQNPLLGRLSRLKLHSRHPLLRYMGRLQIYKIKKFLPAAFPDFARTAFWRSLIAGRPFNSAGDLPAVLTQNSFYLGVIGFVTVFSPARPAGSP